MLFYEHTNAASAFKSSMLKLQSLIPRLYSFYTISEYEDQTEKDFTFTYINQLTNER